MKRLFASKNQIEMGRVRDLISEKMGYADLRVTEEGDVQILWINDAAEESACNLIEEHFRKIEEYLSSVPQTKPLIGGV